MTMERKYEIILTFVLDNEQELYANFDIELYSVLRKKTSFRDFLFDKHQNGFQITPISVEGSIYLNPEIKEVPTPYGQEMIVVGKKIMVLDFFQ